MCVCVCVMMSVSRVGLCPFLMKLCLIKVADNLTYYYYFPSAVSSIGKQCFKLIQGQKFRESLSNKGSQWLLITRCTLRAVFREMGKQRTQEDECSAIRFLSARTSRKMILLVHRGSFWKCLCINTIQSTIGFRAILL